MVRGQEIGSWIKTIYHLVYIYYLSFIITYNLPIDCSSVPWLYILSLIDLEVGKGRGKKIKSTKKIQIFWFCL